MSAIGCHRSLHCGAIIRLAVSVADPKPRPQRKFSIVPKLVRFPLHITDSYPAQLACLNGKYYQ